MLISYPVVIKLMSPEMEIVIYHHGQLWRRLFCESYRTSHGLFWYIPAVSI